jgi:hypothetical protein
MSFNVTTQPPRHASLVEQLAEYLAAKSKSARWLGLVIADDPRLVAGLKRGQTYRPEIMRDLYERLVEFYADELSKEAAPHPLAA